MKFFVYVYDCEDDDIPSAQDIIKNNEKYEVGEFDPYVITGSQLFQLGCGTLFLNDYHAHGAWIVCTGVNRQDNSERAVIDNIDDNPQPSQSHTLVIESLHRHHAIDCFDISLKKVCPGCAGSKSTK